MPAPVFLFDHQSIKLYVQVKVLAFAQCTNPIDIMREAQCCLRSMSAPNGSSLALCDACTCHILSCVQIDIALYTNCPMRMHRRARMPSALTFNFVGAACARDFVFSQMPIWKVKAHSYFFFHFSFLPLWLAGLINRFAVYFWVHADRATYIFVRKTHTSEMIGEKPMLVNAHNDHKFYIWYLAKSMGEHEHRKRIG